MDPSRNASPNPFDPVAEAFIRSLVSAPPSMVERFFLASQLGGMDERLFENLSSDELEALWVAWQAVLSRPANPSELFGPLDLSEWPTFGDYSSGDEMMNGYFVD